MLKAMGVSLVVRKLAQSVKVLQKLTVSDNQFIVMNISKYAEDKTVHFMNVGQRVILTPKGSYLNRLEEFERPNLSNKRKGFRYLYV